MIQLTCTNCRATLVMDDAFAGGVCRCKHCGTIQTVPRPSRRASAPGATPGETPQSKTLFQRPPGFGDLPGSGTGLDDLANVVASSGGLSGTGLQGGSLRQKQPVEAGEEPAAPRPAVPAKKNAPFIAAVIVGAMLFSALITWLAVRDTRDPVPDGAGGGNVAVTPSNGTPTPSPGDARKPSFLGVPITGRTVVYVLDRGSGTRTTFELMKLAAFASLRTLPPDAKFQVVFWEVDTSVAVPGSTTRPAMQGDVKAYPPEGPRLATPRNIAEAQEALKDVYAFGQSRVEPAVRKAMASKPDEVFLATGKYGLESDMWGSVVSLRGDLPTRIHTFALGEAGSPEALKEIAKRTGGQFREVSISDLRQAEE